MPCGKDLACVGIDNIQNAEAGGIIGAADIQHIQFALECGDFTEQFIDDALVVLGDHLAFKLRKVALQPCNFALQPFFLFGEGILDGFQFVKFCIQTALRPRQLLCLDLRFVQCVNLSVGDRSERIEVILQVVCGFGHMGEQFAVERLAQSGQTAHYPLGDESEIFFSRENQVFKIFVREFQGIVDIPHTVTVETAVIFALFNAVEQPLHLTAQFLFHRIVVLYGRGIFFHGLTPQSFV